MATPKTGSISFSQLNSEIMRTSTTTQRSLNEAAQRLGYGATSQVSMSDLRGCAGMTITCGSTYVPATKYVPGYNIDGYTTYTSPVTGSIPNYDWMVVSDCEVRELADTDDVTTGLVITSGGGGEPVDGYRASQLARLAIANTLYSHSAVGNTAATVSYDMPTSGTRTLGLKFT